MPSILAHAVAGVAVGSAFVPPHATRPFWIACALCAALPDIDALGRPFGNLTYESLFGGHRGLTHSIPFAVVLGAVVAWAFFREPQGRSLRPCLWAAFALATASHGFLDALSVIGNGVAFWAPFEWSHYEFVWQPLGAIGGGPRGPARLPALVANEFHWVALPSLIVVAMGWLIRRGRARDVRATLRES